MESFLTHLVKPLVNKPDEVEVEHVDDELHLWVDPDDRGAVIGRRGKTIRALRDLLRAHGDQHGHRVELVLIEDDDEDSFDDNEDSEGSKDPAAKSEEE